MGAGKKYYVVWVGIRPGVYSSWEECKQNVEGWNGAVYKSFDSKEIAEKAFLDNPANYIAPKTPQPKSGGKPARASASGGNRVLPPEIKRCALAVDAACSGNPGQMEYRGIYLAEMTEIFHFGPVLGTNNIGEFLAIVHGLSLLKRKGLDWPVYSDSRNAILWVKNKKCKTTLQRNAKTDELFKVIERAERWLAQNTYNNQIIKWETGKYGEIPADFGRK